MLLSTHSRLLRPRERRSMPVYVKVCAQNARPSPYVHICVCVFANEKFGAPCWVTTFRLFATFVHACPCLSKCVPKKVWPTVCPCVCVCVCYWAICHPLLGHFSIDCVFVWKKFELCFEKMQKFQSLYIAKKFEPNYARKIWNFSKSTCTNRVANGNQSHTHNGHPLVNARQIDFHWPN